MFRAVFFPVPSLLASLLLACLATPAAATTYLVNSASDSAAATDCPGGGNCTLRAALAAANANPGADLIVFGLPQNTTISPVTALPIITGQVTIDARPDPAYDGHPWVYLDGFATSGANGLRLGNGAAGSAIYGIGFIHWDNAGISLGGNAHLVTIDGCYFGRNAIGSTAGNGTGIAVLTDSNTIGKRIVAGAGFAGAGNLVIASSGDGILVGGDANLLYGNSLGGTTPTQGNGVGIRLVLANSNIIGGTEAGDRGGNTVVHSQGAGIIVSGNGNALRGNYVGTTSAGSIRPNLGPGIEVSGENNIIGGSQSLDRNVIANNQEGIVLGTPGAADATQVIGNQVLGNLGTGIRLQAGSGNLFQGNTCDGNGSGGIGDGIRLDGSDNQVVSNVLGSTSGNNGEGIYVSPTASGNTIGPGNLINRNRAGVKVQGPNTTVIGNRLGTAGAGNQLDGVWLVAGSNGALVEENDIDSNSGNGIRAECSDCALIDNRIGLEEGNGAHGIRVSGAVTGVTVGPQNKIGFNALDGVVVTGTGTRVVENRIGAFPTGTAYGNGRHGINVLAGAAGTRIEGNLIEDNANHGVLVSSGPTILLANEIGGHVSGAGYAGHGNGGHGILVQDADDVGIGDGSFAGRNHVIGNGGDGVAIESAQRTHVNFNHMRGNTLSGVALLGGVADANVRSNAIFGNGSKGIHVGHNAGTGNTFRSNEMGSNAVPGIDLAGDGPSPNDAGDGDEGPNRMQNSPVLLFHAPVGDSGLQVGLSVDSSVDNVSYPLTVEVYSSQAAADAPAGEGDLTLGVATYAAPGVASVTVSRPAPGANWLLALATDADGNTSEFSTAVAYVSATGPAVFADGFED